MSEAKKSVDLNAFTTFTMNLSRYWQTGLWGELTEMVSMYADDSVDTSKVGGGSRAQRTRVTVIMSVYMRSLLMDEGFVGGEFD